MDRWVTLAAQTKVAGKVSAVVLALQYPGWGWQADPAQVSPHGALG